MSRHKLKPDDIVYGRRGDIGRQALIRRQQEGWLCGTGCLRLSFGATVIEPLFLHYYLRQEDVIGWIANQAIGATLPNLNTSILRSVPVHVPPLPVQRRIAGILSAYDELMENCQRRIRILEEMARTLHRDWFVHFRFPGHEKIARVDSSLGPIPKGWEVKKLGELAEDMRRNIPKGELDEPQPYVGLEHIPRRSLALDAWETTTDLGSNKLEFKKGEVLFGKIRPYFHKVSVAPFDGLCSADTIVIRARRPEHYAFVVACVSSDDFVAHATATSNGSKMPRANWHVLEEYNVVIPTSEIATRFSRLMCDAIAQQQTLIFKIQNLRRTRDLLLPRLLSGQVSLDVSAVEDVAEPTAPAPPRSPGALGNALPGEVALRAGGVSAGGRTDSHPQTPPPCEIKLRSESHSQVQLGNEEPEEEPALRAAEEAPPYPRGTGFQPVGPAGFQPAESTERRQDARAPHSQDGCAPIDQIDRTEVLQVIRQVFSEGAPRGAQSLHPRPA
ncbi:MAG: restriction endonuclease subunit S, partial [Burkholderiales bacterium]|nr:restriction endonuclease subunit S [Opitutaceae bacterium]